MVTDLFADSFAPPVDDQPPSVGGGVILTEIHQFFLIDTGTIPLNAVISHVQFFITQGSFTPGVIPAGVQPFFLWQLTQWAGPTYAAPPPIGQTFGNNETAAAALTPVLIVNPVTGIPWVVPDLFQAQFGWWNVWNNLASPIPQSVQRNSVTQFLVRVSYSVPTQPDPIVSHVELATLTEVPETYTFRLTGSNFEAGSSVIVTPPTGAALLVTGSAVLRVTPTELDFVVTAAQIGQAGTYTIQVMGPTGQLSQTLTFVMAGPGVIVTPSPGVMHVFGYAFVRPVTPNTTNEPLGLAPNARIDVYESQTTTPTVLYSDPLGQIPLTNPFNADADAMWSCYVVPAAIDVQFSGGGIDTPYTIGDYLPLDPRIPALEAAVTALESDIAGGIAVINGVVAGFQAVPLAFPLGGSLTVGVKTAARVDVEDAVTILLNADLFGSYAVTVFVTLRTEDAGTSVQAVLTNVDDSLNVGSSTASISVTGETLAFSATLTAGSKHYRLQLQPGNGNAFIYGNGYIQLAAP